MAKSLLVTLLIVGVGLIIRVHPVFVFLSLVAWTTFIFASLELYRAQSRTSAGLMVVALGFNAWFHWFLLS